MHIERATIGRENEEADCVKSVVLRAASTASIATIRFTSMSAPQFRVGPVRAENGVGCELSRPTRPGASLMMCVPCSILERSHAASAQAEVAPTLLVTFSSLVSSASANEVRRW